MHASGRKAVTFRIYNKNSLKYIVFFTRMNGSMTFLFCAIKAIPEFCFLCKSSEVERAPAGTVWWLRRFSVRSFLSKWWPGKEVHAVDACVHHVLSLWLLWLYPHRLGQALIRLSRRRRTQFLLIRHRAAVRAHIHHRRRHWLLRQSHQQHLLLHKERTQSRYRISSMCCSH